MNIDIQEIKKWHDALYSPGELFEIRLLGGGMSKKRNWSGYFKSVDTMVNALVPILDSNDQWIGKPQAYFTLNSIHEVLYSRTQHDKFVESATSTSDDDIAKRKLVLIDFDPERPKDTSSSDLELEAAHKKSQEVFKYLRSIGFHEPVFALSGNGYHLLYKIDMPNDNDHKSLISGFLKTLHNKFNGNGVDIDISVINPARVCKLYGTEARKGANTKDRPWRMSRICYVPKSFDVNSDELLANVIFSNPLPTPKEEKNTASYRGSYEGERFDVEAFFSKHNISYRIRYKGASTVYQLETCPWEETHSTHHKWESAIFKDENGRLTFYCWHAHCQGKTWKDFRLHYEPDAYTNHQKYAQMYIPKSKQPEIKKETKELGKIWLSPTDIKKVNLYNLDGAKTGFRDLDKYLVSLHFFEYSVLSGTSGCGKSSWLNTLILNMVNGGTKVALWSGELPSFSLMTWIDLAAAGSKHTKVGYSKDGNPYYYVQDEISNRIRAWLDGKLAIFNSTSYGNKWEQLFENIKEMVTKGFRMFILDNLTAMDVDIIDGDNIKKQKTVVENLHNFCIDNKCHIILVVHPRKGTAKGQRSLLRKEDISGASAITDLADNVFIIHRNNADFRKGVAEFYGKEEAAKYDENGDYSNVGNVIEICKNRMFGNQDKIVRLYFDPVSRRFSDYPNDDFEYNWNTDATATELNAFSDDDPLGAATDEITDEQPF